MIHVAPEQGLADRVVRALNLHGWNVYPEVAPWGAGEARCDIVAVRDPLIMAVEVKARLCSSVLWQARRWIGQVHCVVAAVGITRALRDPLFQDYARHHGIGVLPIPEDPDEKWLCPDGSKKWRWWHDSCPFESGLVPRLFRIRGDGLRAHLHEHQKQYLAGTQAGFSTPWSRTMDRAVDLVAKRPGITVREVVESIDHHYQRDATARACLLTWLARDARLETRVETAGGVRATRFYFVEADLNENATMAQGILL